LPIAKLEATFDAGSTIRQGVPWFWRESVDRSLGMIAQAYDDLVGLETVRSLVQTKGMSGGCHEDFEKTA
jgi:hypothetical protein